MICKNSERLPHIYSPFFKVVTKHTSGFRPYRTDPFFAPLSVYAYACRFREVKIDSFKVYDLLHPGTRIEHEGQKGIIPSSVWNLAVDRIQNGLDLSKSRYSTVRVGERLKGMLKIRCDWPRCSG